MFAQVVDGREGHARFEHHVAEACAHGADLDAVDDDAEALEVEDGLEVVEVGVVDAEVGDEGVHLLLVAEADVGDEAHEGLEKEWVAANERALDVVQEELQLLGVAAQRRELAVHVCWLFTRLWKNRN